MRLRLEQVDGLIYKSPRKLDAGTATQIYDKLVDLVTNSVHDKDRIESKVATLRQENLNILDLLFPLQLRILQINTSLM